MNEYMIAMDVGGTKTDAVLFTPDGTVLRHTVTPGANALDVGMDEAIRRYLNAIHSLCGDDIKHLRSVYAGIAAALYFGTKIHDILRPHVDADILHIDADGPALISTMLGHTDGAALICGTGSSLTIRKGDQSDVIGGWGYLIDGCSSGFILGKRAVYAAVREYDGRGPKTIMTDLLHKRCGMPIVDHFEQLYSGGRPYIASLAGIVFEARKAGDRVAAEIFEECIDDLNELVWTAHRKLGGAYSLVLNGGIFRTFPEYVQALKALAPMDVTMVDSDAPPIYGCAVEAMYDAGYTCDDAFKQKFMAGYNAK